MKTVVNNVIYIYTLALFLYIFVCRYYLLKWQMQHVMSISSHLFQKRNLIVERVPIIREVPGKSIDRDLNFDDEGSE
jgi:hypothetical protein